MKSRRSKKRMSLNAGGSSQNTSSASFISTDDESTASNTSARLSPDNFQSGPYHEKPEDTVIPAKSLNSVYTKKHADEDRLFREEFQATGKHVKGLSRNFSIARDPENKPKNRYKNIVTCNESRVVLNTDNPDDSDYINASYMSGFSFPKKFIATQGPKDETLDDFWKMVWERNCFTIVMITEIRENSKPFNSLPSPFKPYGQKKCSKYWPQDETIEYGKISVKHSNTYQYGGFTKRTFHIRHLGGAESRIVYQYHYRAWPDHGVPKTTSELFRFRWRALSSQPEFREAGPVIVHCSAGVGRTGTFIGLDYLLHEYREKSSVDICSMVINMRKNRTDMVQSVDQYSYLHKLIMEWHLFGDTDIPSEKFNDVYMIMKRSDLIPEKKFPIFHFIGNLFFSRFSGTNSKTKLTGFKRQFNLFEKCYPPKSSLTLAKKNSSENRNDDVLTYNHSAVTVRMRGSELTPPYFNASVLECYDRHCTLIASQDPFPNSRETFWRLIIDNNVRLVVMLSPLRESNYADSDESSSDDSVADGLCPIYWPTSGTVDYGDVSIEYKSNTLSEKYNKIKLSAECGRDSIDVTHIRLFQWDNADVVSTNLGETIVQLASMAAEELNREEGGVRPTVLVHCHDGAAKTGIFCALINIMHRLELEERIDVFRAVKDLRDFRQLMVRTEKQYELCYDLVKLHLEKRNTQA